MTSRLTRREALSATLLAGVAGALPIEFAQAAAGSTRLPETPVRWIDGAAPALDLGQTFGIPWPRGVLRAGKPLSLHTRGGQELPSQHWTLATWPDGSVKWSAHALAAGAGGAEEIMVAPGRPASPRVPVSARSEGDSIIVRSGDLVWEIGRSGDALLRAARIGDRMVLGPVTLRAASRNDPEKGDETRYSGRIERTVIEQAGPVRAVIRVEGVHEGAGRRWLPFTIRLYAYAGATALRIVHSFIFDGDPARDFVSGLGISAQVPMRAALHDRHVRFGLGGKALFTEAVRPLTGLRRDPGAAFRAAQVAGRAVPPLGQMAPAVRDRLDAIPAWGDFTLRQLSANGFTLAKRTATGHGWVDAGEGHRAPGLAYVGGPDGGVAIGQRYFWERHPAQLDIRAAASNAATLTAWLWSPDAAPMDLRPYRGVMGMEGYDAQNAGLDVTYEDYEPGWDNAHGIARTSELTLWACDTTPSAETLTAMARAVATPPQLMAAPERIHAAGVFGDWSLPDRSTSNRAVIEDQLANLVDFYAGEVDRRSWYGFWNHGDVMHSYDSDRHQWRYDIGGFAWANSELSPDLWLWYAALRSGDARTFRLAEAMTRHTGEVDVHHIGRFAGLGTRHGVQHWSDSSKQPRVSNAAYRRIFYYLTADERVGDLMRALVASDHALQTVVIGRKVPGKQPPPPPPGMVEMSFGTSWCSLAAAWLTEWERTGDKRWRDRLIAGMDSIGRMPRGWMTGGGLFDLASGRFRDPGDKISLSHLNAVFGAVEINAELLALLDVPRYRTAWLDYCRWYNAPQADYLARFGPPFGPRNLREGHSRLTAYAARHLPDPALELRAAEEFYSGQAGLGTVRGDPRRTLPDGTVEWRNVSTNAASQWGLAAIQNLALVPEALDKGDLSPAGRRPEAAP
ncbi:Tat pathway signal sequence domain protein [Sphingopyxis sp.]|uniref:exo-rhamnogalacturonan lyase family protein n=1 Tax=Sphingopyxis sp. TaxID=1908224 RepID=UPI002B4942BC|nr:Tat pathway signal sequence domain protein [Sphingopyxis sp.]HJS11856.1 Tat pathway signal sequence domain protein [Sphingopyxis sp.]